TAIMAYRKLAADNIFTGEEMLDGNFVLVIDDLGIVQDIISAGNAGTEIERYQGIITPGFINCHCHLELSHMRGAIPEKTGMVDFLLAVMSSRNTDEEEIQLAIKSADAEMRKNGIVAVGDICNTEHTISLKKSSGINYHNFIEATGFVPATAKTRFNSFVELYNKFTGIGNSSIVPHAPYSVSKELFSLINNFKSDQLLTMHNQESAAENEFFLTAEGDFLKLFSAIGVDLKHFNRTGKSSLLSSIENISVSHRMILVHNVLTDKKDIEGLGARINNIYWCFCPNANIYINNNLPDISLIREYSSDIVLGTDSLASNHQLNILAEIKTLQDNFPLLTLAELLKWATLNGAKALGIDKQYGSFQKGKKPGINLINNSTITPLQVPVKS
ncbi:MAG: amidohydrolase family protein, partial [Chitinophagaceae bacterium]|nr:amidohydrolase family protein [Chitinophagaceae bacterium]